MNDWDGLTGMACYDDGDGDLLFNFYLVLLEIDAGLNEENLKNTMIYSLKTQHKIIRRQTLFI